MDVGLDSDENKRQQRHCCQYLYDRMNTVSEWCMGPGS
jgi:hypothetical protein